MPVVQSSPCLRPPDTQEWTGSMPLCAGVVGYVKGAVPSAISVASKVRCVLPRHVESQGCDQHCALPSQRQHKYQELNSQHLRRTGWETESHAPLQPTTQPRTISWIQGPEREGFYFQLSWVPVTEPSVDAKTLLPQPSPAQEVVGTWISVRKWFFK